MESKISKIIDIMCKDRFTNMRDTIHNVKHLNKLLFSEIKIYTEVLGNEYKNENIEPFVIVLNNIMSNFSQHVYTSYEENVDNTRDIFKAECRNAFDFITNDFLYIYDKNIDSNKLYTYCKHLLYLIDESDVKDIMNDLLNHIQSFDVETPQLNHRYSILLKISEIFSKEEEYMHLAISLQILLQSNKIVATKLLLRNISSMFQVLSDKQKCVFLTSAFFERKQCSPDLTLRLAVQLSPIIFPKEEVADHFLTLHYFINEFIREILMDNKLPSYLRKSALFILNKVMLYRSDFLFDTNDGSAADIAFIQCFEILEETQVN